MPDKPTPTLKTSPISKPTPQKKQSISLTSIHQNIAKTWNRTSQFFDQKDFLTIPRLLWLLPLLYTLLAFLLPADVGSDKMRYITYAENLIQGFYSPPGKIYLWNGPGYPLLLTPIAWLNLPWDVAKLYNIFFLFGAITYLFKALRLWLNRTWAMSVAALCGLYPAILWYLPYHLTEILTLFIVCGAFYHLLHAQIKAQKRKWLSMGLHTLLAILFFGFLALTKIFFGWVLLINLILALLIFLWLKQKRWLHYFLIMVGALLVTTPYLSYTYQLTGKLFYWGNSGGVTIYWMSTPYPGDLGSFFGNIVDLHTPQNRPGIPNEGRFGRFQQSKTFSHHQEFAKTLSGLDNLAVDEALRKKAIENIKNHPQAFLHNWIANIGRLFFSYPFGHSLQKLSTYVILLPNAFLLTLTLLALYPLWKKWPHVPPALQELSLFALTTVGGASLLAAYARQFFPILPILVLLNAFVWSQLVQFQWRTPKEE
ncbi:hypothetical protein ACQZV8_15165 [Magnetococcales bacterium HHB-1]